MSQENPEKPISEEIEFNMEDVTNSISNVVNSSFEEVGEKEDTEIQAPKPEDAAEEVVDDAIEENQDEPIIENENNEDDESPWSIIANEFKGSILDDSDFESEDFKFDGSKESFTEMISRKTEKEAERIVDEIIDSLPDKIKNPVKNYIEGLDVETAFKTSNELSKFENVTRESLTANIEKAKDIYRTNLLNKGISKEKVEKYVERAVDLDEIVDEALDASKEEVTRIKQETENKKLETQKQAQEFAKKQAERIENLKNDIMNSNELFKGIPTTDIIKKKVYENMTKPVGNDANGKPLTKIQMLAQKNPEEFYKLLNTYEVLGLFDQDKNGKFIPKLDKLTTYKKSEKIDSETTKAKRAASMFKGGQSNSSIDTRSLSDNLKSIKQAFEKSEAS